jgi:hypothetical protein
MFNGLVTTLLILALGFLGYDASLRTRVVKERAAVTAPASDTGDMHAMDGGDGFPPPPRP